MKLLLSLLLFVSTVSYAQPSDFIILKKKNKTVTTYYAGSQIEFTTLTGAYHKGLINRIHNDTIYLQEFITQIGITTFGTYITDTIGSYRYSFHYNQLAQMGKKQRRGFNVNAAGASLFGGGALLVVGSGVVYLADRSKFSLPLLLASAGLGTLGYILMKSGHDEIVIGKKYHLMYMSVTQNKN